MEMLCACHPIHSSFCSSPLLSPFHTPLLPPPPSLSLSPPFPDSASSLRCVVCEQCLPESYYQLEEQPYCRDHYYERTAHKCQRCSDYITGPTMVGGCPFPVCRSGNGIMMVMSHSQTCRSGNGIMMGCLIPKHVDTGMGS